MLVAVEGGRRTNAEFVMHHLFNRDGSQTVPLHDVCDRTASPATRRAQCQFMGCLLAHHVRNAGVSAQCEWPTCDTDARPEAFVSAHTQGLVPWRRVAHNIVSVSFSSRLPPWPGVRRHFLR